MKRLILSLALILAVASPAFAQGPTTTQQSAQSLTAATNCTTATAAAAAAVTLTITPPGATSVYLTVLEVTNYASTAETGNAAPNLVTITGIPGAPVLTMGTGLAIGQVERLVFPMPMGTKGLVNTNVVVTTPAFAGALWRVNACYYFAAP